MTQQTFRRAEEKYVLSRAQYIQLTNRLAGEIVPDAYGKNTIRNIYFDTPDFRLIRASIDATVYKEKLRLRGYGRVGDCDTVFLELKKKVKGIVYKRRVPMTLSQAKGYLSGKGAPADGQIMREIDYFARLNAPLFPRVFLAYERCAYLFPGAPGLRLTFDENIRARADDVRLDGNDAGDMILSPGEVVMELKLAGAIPVPLARTLAALGVYSRGFSKVGTYYETRLINRIERTEKRYA
jgi:hypothetical protein